jgi:hypothetical protein
MFVEEEREKVLRRYQAASSHFHLPAHPPFGSVSDDNESGVTFSWLIEDSGLWRKMKSEMDSPFRRALIRCSDASIVWPGSEESKSWDLTTRYQYSGFRARTGDELTLSLRSSGTLPRRTMCNEYPRMTMWTFGYVDAKYHGNMKAPVQGTEQDLIMVCEQTLHLDAWIDPSTGQPETDTRLVSCCVVAYRPLNFYASLLETIIELTFIAAM